MPDDVVLNKVAIIERCLNRVREEYFGHAIAQNRLSDFESFCSLALKLKW